MGVPKSEWWWTGSSHALPKMKIKTKMKVTRHDVGLDENGIPDRVGWGDGRGRRLAGVDWDARRRITELENNSAD
jgi:hypothetical protein